MRPRRLSLDTKKLEQPQDCYTFGKNGVWNANVGAEENENGFLPSNISIPYVVIGIIETDTYPVYFSTNNQDSAFGFHDTDQDIYVPIFDDVALNIKLNFNTNRPIKGEFRRNFRNEIELTWIELATTGANPPRWANTVRLGTDINDFLLFPKSLIPFISTTMQPGGNLGMGTYFFALQYIRNDGTETRYTTLTSPLIAFSDNYSTIPGANTGKAITLNITGIDQSYDRIGLVVVERINGVDTPYTLPELPVAPNVTFIYTGAEKQTQLTMDEVLIPAAYYENAYAITQLTDQLYLANMTEETIIDWQQYANMVKVRWKSELVNAASRPVISTESGQQRGHMHEEVAALYMVLKLRTGRNSRAFPIPGPAPLSGDLATSTLASGQNIAAKVYQVEDTCRNITTTDNTGDCGVWVNQNELYPDLPQFDSTSIGGENLRGQPVRHHRMPSLRFCKINLYGGNPDYGRASLDTLGLQVSNVIIPADLQDQVIGWELHYAKKDYNNSLVLGQSLTMFGAQANQDSGISGNITSTGGNWGSYQRTGGSGATTDPESLRLINNHVRFHALDILLNRPSINPAYINLQLTSVLRFNGNCLATNNANEVIYSLDYTNGAGNIDPISVPTDNNHFYKVTDGQYVTTNSNADDFMNIRLEDAYVMNLPNPGPNLMNSSGWTWIKRDYTNGNNNHPIFELVYLANLMSLRTDLYLSYFSQALVRTGAVFPATQQASATTIYGGDCFISKYSFITYGLVTKQDVVSNTGRADWKTLDTDGIKAVHFFICESVADGACRYEIPGDTYSQFPPKSTLTNSTDNFLYNFSRNNNPNSIGYSRDCNAVGDLLNGIIIASPYDQFVQQSPTKIVRSVKQVSESVINSWKNFNALDYYEAIKNKGPIINLCGMNDRLIIHHRDGLFITRSKATFNTDITQVTLGTGDIFQFDPNEVRPAHLGYGGTTNPLACYLTPIGYMFPDNITGELFLFDGANLTNIGVGIINFLLKYLTIKEINNYIGNGIIIGYEQFYKRIMLTVKNVSVSSNSLVFVPNYQPTSEFFGSLTPNVSVVYKDGRYQLFKGVNTSEYECPTNDVPTLPNAAFTSNEHVPNGTTIGTVTATGGVGPYTYIITTINKGGLVIDPLTGIITVGDSTAFDYTESVLSLTVEVTDANSNSATNSTAVTINKVDSIPVLPAYVVIIPEHSSNGTVVNTEVATDRDGKAITYSITAGNSLAGFVINPTTGVVTVNDTIKLDYFSNPNFVLTIRATTITTGAFAENPLTINLSYVHQPPIVTNTTFSAEVNTTNGTVVAILTPATQRAGQSGDLIYELVTDSIPAGAFEVIVDPTDADFLKVKVLDETKLSTANDDYIITIKVYDPSFPSDSSNFTITGHLYATAEANYNQTEQSVPYYVDINSQIVVDGISVVDIDFNESGSVAVSGVIVLFRAFNTVLSTAPSPTITMEVTRTLGGVVTVVFPATTIPAVPGTPIEYSEHIVEGAVYNLITNSQSSGYSSAAIDGPVRKNDCGTGQTGTFVEVHIPAGTYTSMISQAAADALATAAAQAYANDPANGGSCLVDSTISTILVDFQDDTSLDLCGYILTPGLVDSGQIVASIANGGPLMYPNDGRDPSTAVLLSSDKLSPNPVRRFGINAAYLAATYSGSISFVDIEFRGRGATAGTNTLGGSIGARNITEGHLIMSGTPGINAEPGVSMGTSTPTGFATSIVSGANGAVSLTTGNPVLTIRFTFASSTLGITTY